MQIIVAVIFLGIGRLKKGMASGVGGLCYRAELDDQRVEPPVSMVFCSSRTHLPSLPFWPLSYLRAGINEIFYYTLTFLIHPVGGNTSPSFFFFFPQHLVFSPSTGCAVGLGHWEWLTQFRLEGLLWEALGTPQGTNRRSSPTGGTSPELF